ncbi:hypothetical protein L226DRAFT_522067 [Lentinus tigrinus ALCF2SS1-7]|uniref:uncharacterized protein n=1 Tax=Lentinus tigrinus ALCF2SS1-7 TaxID=1328758 RepID=UPI001165CC56|nr:hypothetical protein L226DRAFT_522067 [Lentinus tigrinus ALCF2SS1-7]
MEQLGIAKEQEEEEKQKVIEKVHKEELVHKRKREEEEKRPWVPTTAEGSMHVAHQKKCKGREAPSEARPLKKKLRIKPIIVDDNNDDDDGDAAGSVLETMLLHEAIAPFCQKICQTGWTGFRVETWCQGWVRDSEEEYVLSESEESEKAESEKAEQEGEAAGGQKGEQEVQKDVRKSVNKSNNKIEYI